MPSFFLRRKLLRKAKRAKGTKKKHGDSSTAKAKPKKGRAKRKSMKIIDLNDDCLIGIFEHLSFDELLCVAQAHKRFQPSARSVFARKFAIHPVTVTNFNEKKTIRSLPSAVVLRHFGDLIIKLRVKYHSDFQRFNLDLEKAICKYGQAAAIEIEFVNSDMFAFGQIKKQPFQLVKKVLFTRCVPSTLAFDFNKWFPNATHLDFLKPKIFNWHSESKCIHQKFPKLEHLGIINARRGDEGFDYKYATHNEVDSLIIRNPLTNVNLKAFIVRNRGLRSLKLKHINDAHRDEMSEENYGIKITITFLIYLNEKLPLLEHLDLTVTQLHLIEDDFDDKSKLMFKNLTKLTINFQSSFTLAFLPIHTNRLDELVLSGEELDEESAKFLQLQEKCKKLTLRGKWRKDECCETAIEAIKGLTGLECVEIPLNGLTNKQLDIMSLLDNCESLKELSVAYRKSNVFLTNLVDSEANSDDDYEKHSYQRRQRNLVQLSEVIERLPGIFPLSMFMICTFFLITSFSFVSSGWEAKHVAHRERVSRRGPLDILNMLLAGLHNPLLMDNEDESDDSEEEQDDDNGNPNQNFNQAAFEEMFRSAFETKYLGSQWQSSYSIDEKFYWAKFVKLN